MCCTGPGSAPATAIVDDISVAPAAASATTRARCLIGVGSGDGRERRDDCERAASVAQQGRELARRTGHRLGADGRAHVAEECVDPAVARAGRVGEPVEDVVDNTIARRGVASFRSFFELTAESRQPASL